MKIGIIGAGKIGVTIAALLEASEFCSSVLIGDHRREVELPRSRKLRFRTLDATRSRPLEAFVRGCDALVSAAPFFLNKSIATACARRGVAYFDLTEDVETTGCIRKLARGSGVTFMPQCGLAPGAINIIAGGLAAEFKTVRSLELRVGALPLYASNSMKYYLSWSTAGLINEYCHLSDALYAGQRIKAVPLEGLEKISIDGVEYEAFNTSGGVATMCETFKGRIDDLTYKTIRYPGHRDLIRFLLEDLNLARNPKVLTEIFDQEVPMTTQDVVIAYVNAVGLSTRRRLTQRSFMKKILGGVIEGAAFSAIQLSTAGGLLAVLEMFHRGRLAKGFVKQESVDAKEFLATHWGGRIYGSQQPD